jgi:hypothetical protein
VERQRFNLSSFSQLSHHLFCQLVSNFSLTFHSPSRLCVCVCLYMCVMCAFPLCAFICVYICTHMCMCGHVSMLAYVYRYQVATISCQSSHFFTRATPKSVILLEFIPRLAALLEKCGTG